MPLQNRVDPFGELLITPARGLFMGNRGGKIHNEDKRLAKRRWASKQWICCVLDFKNRQRDVWGRYYTELFFLDEVIALAAGHRPCFECRRNDANEFAARWRDAFKCDAPPYAQEMDEALHGERLDGHAKYFFRHELDDLHNGVMIVLDGKAFAVRGGELLQWTPSGYGPRRPRPHGMTVDVLTPPSIAAVLKAGYRPQWHSSGMVSAPTA